MNSLPVGIADIVNLGASFAITGAIYYVYRRNQSVVEKLDDAPHLTIDGRLKDILQITPGARLQYVVLEGAVEPVVKSLKSKFQKEAVGVLQKYMVKQQRLLWNGFTRSWSDNEQILLQNLNAVPFTLVGPDETAVNVLSPQQSSGDLMEIIYEKFHQANLSLSDIVGQYLSGEKIKGQLETEEMLKVGTILTGVGELILEKDGTLNLRPPTNSAPYFLSIKDFNTLRQNRENVAFWWKALAIASALATTFALFWVGRSYYNSMKVRWQRDQARRDFERRLSEAPRVTAPAAATEANNELETVCVICLSQPRNCILLDCGHVCCCFTCYQALPRQNCPICRQRIRRVVPLYLV
ncbi:mitochondrial ubiquitin ligase activator of nfkb 1-A [Solea solea]|uniref:mitochondrial ubiquitin ligase activator of nfkb 1-A n=1 Tax=Solea solea TaxID=90069 RepID=UPI00272D01C7|nr:mitochondrial ubiquitin ligase activator of nfkb 1-A [Solea solea]XP_058492633.1 mitochondrial ubiquitin ligase activator of nfkb 1-A [Solea solea]